MVTPKTSVAAAAALHEWVQALAMPPRWRRNIHINMRRASGAWGAARGRRLRARGTALICIPPGPRWR